MAEKEYYRPRVVISEISMGRHLNKMPLQVDASKLDSIYNFKNVFLISLPLS